MAKLLSGTRIYGNATVDSNLTVSGTTTSNSNSTGTLTVSGGVGVKGNVYSDMVYINNQQAATMGDALAVAIALG